jgi:hypothetical protein
VTRIEQTHSMPYRITSAETITLHDLAGLLTRAFEGYTYPINPTPEQLARRIRYEQIDLEGNYHATGADPD